MIYPCLTLYQPWATWIIRGWKTIETRIHNRFQCLKGKHILIHAGKKTDAAAINNPYLTKEQLLHNPDEMINGYIIGGAFVYDFKALNDTHSKDALIECESAQRFGLFLNQIWKLSEPIEINGELGIWYFDYGNMKKVKKNVPEKYQQLIFDL